MPPDLQDLRLLLVGDWPPPPGGVSVHVRALRDAAVKAGAHVTVIDIGKDQHHAEGVFPSGREAQFLGRLLAMLPQNDVAHLHTSGANRRSWMVVGAIGLAARACGTIPVATFHSGHGPAYLETSVRALAARAALAPYWRVVCVNHEIRQHLEQIGAPARRLLIAPAFGREGVEPGELPASVAAFIADHFPIVSAALAPGRDYGGDDLLEAFDILLRTHPRAGLIVYGPGTGEPDRLRGTGGRSAPILRLGEVGRPEGLAVVQASHVFVRPTHVDGDAMSVREALALGVRVVATRAGHRPPGVTLCDPADATDLARALEASLNAPPPTATEPGPDGIDSVLRTYAIIARRRTKRAA